LRYAGLLAESAVAALVPFAFPPALHTLWYGPGFAAAPGLLFIIDLLGLGLGPLGVGAVSDFLPGPMGLGSAEASAGR